MYIGIIQEVWAGLKQLNPDLDPDKCRMIPCENKTRLSMDGVEHDIPPFEGKVVLIHDQCIVVKEHRRKHRYYLVDRRLATQVPEVGMKVKVTPYHRRNFDGSRVDGCQFNNGLDSVYDPTCFYGGFIKLPFPRPESYKLGYLYDRINELRSSDGTRYMTQILADAKASDFFICDHDNDYDDESPPRIEFNVSTSKFEGLMCFSCYLDMFWIQLLKDGEVIKQEEFSYEMLVYLIGDSDHEKIRIEILK